jgi:hypothetical protein
MEPEKVVEGATKLYVFQPGGDRVERVRRRLRGETLERVNVRTIGLARDDRFDVMWFPDTDEGGGAVVWQMRGFYYVSASTGTPIKAVECVPSVVISPQKGPRTIVNVQFRLPLLEPAFCRSGYEGAWLVQLERLTTSREDTYPGTAALMSIFHITEDGGSGSSLSL